MYKASNCEKPFEVKLYTPFHVHGHIPYRYSNLTYRKSSIKPPGGGLFNFWPSRGGLNREGGLFTKSSDKDIFGSFSVPLSHIVRNQRTILRLKYIKSTQFSSQACV